MMSKIKGNTWFKILNICIFACVIYCLFTYGRAHIQADNAQSVRYAKAVLEDKSLFPRTWNFNNGEFYFFNSMTLAVIAEIVIGNQSLAVVIGSLITIALAVLGIIWFSRQVYEKESWLIAVPLFLVFLSSDQARYMIIYQAAYTMQMVAITLVFGLLYVWYKKTAGKSYRNRYLVIHFLLLFMMTVGGPRYLAEYTLPIIIAYVFMYYRQIRDVLITEERVEIIALTKFLLAVVIPSLLGIIAYKLLLTNHSMVGNGIDSAVLADSLTEVFSNFMASVENCLVIFGYVGGASLVSLTGLKSMIAVVISLIICVIVPILQAIDIRKEEQSVQLYYAFGLAHNLILFILTVFCSKTSERYLLSSVFVWIIVSSRYLYDRLLSRKKYKAVLWGTLFVVATIIELLALGVSTKGWKQGLESQERVCQELQARGLTQGYASYWTGYPFQVYSDNDIEFGGVQLSERTVTKYYCLNSDKVFERDTDKSFIMLTKEEDESFRAGVSIQLGDWIDDFVIEDVYLCNNFEGLYNKTDLIVYVFDYDIATKMSDGIHDGIIDVSELYFNWIGTRTEGEIYLSNGGQVFGPYSRIEPGQYTLTYEGFGFDFCTVDVYSDEKNDAISYEVVSTDETTATVKLTVKELVNDIQFRVFNNTDNQACVTKIRVE